MSDDIGTFTHDGVTVSSNQQSTAQMEASFETPEPAPGATQPETTATPEKRPNPRKDLSARVEQLSAEVGNKNQTIETLNARLAEIDALKREVQTLKAPRQPERREPEAGPAIDWSGFTLKSPMIDDFASSDDPYMDLAVAKAKWEIKRDTYAERQVESRKADQTAQQKAFEDRTETFQRRLSEAQKTDETFSTRIDTLLTERGNPPMPPPMFEVLTESEVGPQLFLHLLEHPEDLTRVLTAPSPKAMYREMNKLEARVEAAGSTGSAPPVRKTTSAHPPINPVVGSHPAPKDGPPGDDASYEEHAAYWNRKEREDRLARR